MTENLADLGVRPSYEELRDRIPDSTVREMWRAGDADAARARTEMQSVHEDETLSEEGKKLAAQRIIDRYAGKAQQHYAEAREKAARSVDNAYNFSVPMPDGGALATSRAKDSSELLAIQGETARIVQKVTGKSLQAMTKEVSQNPRDEGMREAAGKRAQALRKEYDRAMQLGGLEGKVLAHATLRAAEAMGVDYDSVVDEFRNDQQRRYVQEALQLQSMSGSIPSGRDLAKNPYDGNRRGGKKRVGTYGSANKASLSGGRPQLFQKKNRWRPWKWEKVKRGGSLVPRTCTVCAHEDAVLINEALVVQGQSNRAITRQYALSKDAIRRHREHIPELLLKASQAMEVAEADALLDQVRDLQQHALDIMDKAEQAGELRTALAAISQARGNLELLGKLAGELQQEGATNIQIALIEHPDYRRLEELIFRALEHHHQARWDVAEALKELE